MKIFLTKQFIIIDGTMQEFAGPNISAASLNDAKIKCPKGFKVVGKLVAEVSGDVIVDYDDLTIALQN